LQVHDQKQESWLLVQGRAVVIWQDATGALVEAELRPGYGYSTQLGQQHHLKIQNKKVAADRAARKNVFRSTPKNILGANRLTGPWLTGLESRV